MHKCWADKNLLFPTACSRLVEGHQHHVMLCCWLVQERLPSVTGRHHDKTSWRHPIHWWTGIRVQYAFWFKTEPKTHSQTNQICLYLQYLTGFENMVSVSNPIFKAPNIKQVNAIRFSSNLFIYHNSINESEYRIQRFAPKKIQIKPNKAYLVYLTH